jgi:polysaccharide biosynthesis/export protein
MFRIASIVIFSIVSSLCAVAGPTNDAQSKELIQYIRDAKKAGLSETQIQQNATKGGWDPTDVAAALAIVRRGSGEPSAVAKGNVPVTTEQPQSAPAATATEGARPAEPSTIKSPESPRAEAPAQAPKPAESSPAPTADSAAISGDAAAAIDRNVSDEYVIGEGDVLQVHVWNEPTASVPNAVVRPDGMITVPLVHQVQVARLTPSQVEKLLAGKLQEFDTAITPASITVVVSQINSKKVYMTGALKREGPIPYNYRMTVMQALSEAGGLTEYAKPKDIYILRNENGRQYQFRFDYRAVLKGQHVESNIQLRPGDTVVVPN